MLIIIIITIIMARRLPADGQRANVRIRCRQTWQRPRDETGVTPREVFFGYTIPYYTILYYTILYYTIPYSSVEVWGDAC